MFFGANDIADGTTTLQLGTDVIDLDSGDFPDVTSSDVEDNIRKLITKSQRGSQD